MKHVIVTKKFTDGGFGKGLSANNVVADELEDLAVGAITMGRSSDNTLLQYDSAEDILESAIKDNETVYFAQMMPDGNIWTTSPINPKDLKWTKKTAVAYNKKEVDLGYSSTNDTDTLELPTLSDSIGKVATIRIYDLSAAPGVLNNVRTIDYQIKSGDTDADVHNALFTKLEKLEGEFYESVTKDDSGSKYGYTFTGISGKDFRILAEGILEGTPVTVNTELAIGNGVGSDIVKAEKDSFVRRGYNPSDMAHDNMFTQEGLADSSTSYDVFVLNWTNPNKHYLAGGTDPMVQELLIAAPTSNSSNNQYDISAQISTVLEALADSTVVWETTE